ncbi:histidine triad nucleotide-binding protein [Thermodesulfobacteriota bacterium]
MAGCIFCKIVEGKLPSDRLYEDDRVVAFWDANPTAPIHVLIVPRKHVATLNDLPEDDPILSHIGEVAKIVAKKLGVAESGYRFMINVNKGGGQVIFHLHAHVIAGTDMGVRLIKFAILLASTWKRIKNKLTGGPKRPRTPK